MGKIEHCWQAAVKHWCCRGSFYLGCFRLLEREDSGPEFSLSWRHFPFLRLKISQLPLDMNTDTGLRQEVISSFRSSVSSKLKEISFLKNFRWQGNLDVCVLQWNITGVLNWSSNCCEMIFTDVYRILNVVYRHKIFFTFYSLWIASLL